MLQNSDFYIFMPLSVSLFNYLKLKHARVVAEGVTEQPYEDYRTFLISYK